MNLLIFVYEGVKIYQNIYRRHPSARCNCRRLQWTLQQDSVPAQRAKATKERCKAIFFLLHHICGIAAILTGSQPLYYSIWSILEAMACAKPHKNVEALKQLLQWGWDRLSADELRRTALNFRKSLPLCVDEKGGKFEAN